MNCKKKTLELEGRIRSRKALKRIVDSIGSQYRTAQMLNIEPSAVNNWIHGRGIVPPRYCILLMLLIENIYPNIDINLNDLRPDIFPSNIKLVSMTAA